VLQALEKVKPYMESHGGKVKLVRLEDGVAHLRLEGGGDGRCDGSAATMELAVEKALEESVPDLAGIEVVGFAPPPPPFSGTALPLRGGGPE
jgi:Fe-S cluster biogenesis protein NfuA